MNWILIILLLLASFTTILVVEDPILLGVATVTIWTIQISTIVNSLYSSHKWCRDTIDKIFNIRSINWRLTIAPIWAILPRIRLKLLNDKISRMFRGLPCQGKQLLGLCQGLKRKYFNSS